jgi:probable phosphoglycerate mutase
VWERLAAEFAGRTVIVVAHGMVCKVLMLSILEGWSAARWKEFGPVPNLGMSELCRDGRGWRAETRNVVPPAIAQIE